MKHLSFSIIFSCLFLMLCAFKLADHEFYFTVMTMERNLETNSLETEFRFYTDDLETALGQNEDYFIRLGDDREVPEADSLIFDYIFEKVKISGTGWEDATINFLGKRVENDLTYLYIEYSNIKSWGEVTITNNILFEHFSKQSNQLSFLFDDQIKTETCYIDYPVRTINLKP